MSSRKRKTRWGLALIVAIIVGLGSCVVQAATKLDVRQATVESINQDDGISSTSNVIVVELQEYDGVHKRPCDMLREPVCNQLTKGTFLEFFAAGWDGAMSRVVIVPHG